MGGHPTSLITVATTERQVMALAFQLALADELAAERRRLEWALKNQALWDGEALLLINNKEHAVVLSDDGDMRATLDEAIREYPDTRPDPNQLRFLFTEATK